jgi:hypothetical protein
MKKYEEQKPADGSPSGRQSSLVGMTHQFPQSVSFSVYPPDTSAGFGPASPAPDTAPYKKISVFLAESLCCWFDGFKIGCDPPAPDEIL